jgi:hypothetical protein
LTIWYFLIAVENQLTPWAWSLIGRTVLMALAIEFDFENAIVVPDPVDDARADDLSSGISYILYFKDDDPALTAMTFAILMFTSIFPLSILRP